MPGVDELLYDLAPDEPGGSRHEILRSETPRYRKDIKVLDGPDPDGGNGQNASTSFKVA